jgi:putative oxidoreductase
VDLQRLFSTFANGWPGLGLLLQRLLSASALFFDGIPYFGEAPHASLPVLRLIGAGTGIFVLVGLWTPVTGMLVAIIELYIAFSHTGDPWISILLATLGATLAMIGPGAWSIDAQLFGRKHFED